MTMTKKDRQREAEMRAEDDHRTLTRAAEIQGDGERMRHVVRHHRKQTRALNRVGRSLGARGGRA